MLAEVLSTLNIAEKIMRVLGWAKGKRQAAPETVPARFIRLFESHDVHRSQIPRFFGHALTLKDIEREPDLLSKLDEQALQDACDLFAVRREWLDGAEPTIYSCHDFYKSPEDVADFLEALKEATPDGDLGGILIAPQRGDGQALIVLTELVGAIGEKQIYRYHLLNNWRFRYWKARGYLAACVAIAWRHGVYLHGAFADAKVIEKLAFGAQFPGPQLEALRHKGAKWYPEDMSLKPDVFLKDVDPELNRFGISSAIDLWLALDDKGFMDPGLGMYDRGDVRKQFQAAHLGIASPRS